MKAPAAQPIAVGDNVEYARSKHWIVDHITESGSLALIADMWDSRVVPVSRLKKVEKK